VYTRVFSVPPLWRAGPKISFFKSPPLFPNSIYGPFLSKEVPPKRGNTGGPWRRWTPFWGPPFFPTRIILWPTGKNILLGNPEPMGRRKEKKGGSFSPKKGKGNITRISTVTPSSDISNLIIPRTGENLDGPHLEDKYKKSGTKLIQYTPPHTK